MYSLTKFFETANQNAVAINRKVIEITQRNLNLGFDLAKSFAEGIRNPSEIVRLQTSYWRKQFGQLTAQAEKLRDDLLGFSRARYTSSPEPSVEEPAKTSSTPSQKAKSPTPRKTATSRREQPGTLTPGLSGRSEQPEISKKGDATNKLERTQKSPARDSVDKGAKPQAARKIKTRPSSSPAPHSTPTNVSFGMLDGNAVRFTNLEAWWLVDGTWRPISPEEVLSNAAVMREARFKQLFPQIPQLPKKAFRSPHR